MKKRNKVAEVMHTEINGWKRSKSIQEVEIKFNQRSNLFMVIIATFIYVTDALNTWFQQFISENGKYETELKSNKLKCLKIKQYSVYKILNISWGFIPQQIVWK
jgi:hypothetical protein